MTIHVERIVIDVKMNSVQNSRAICFGAEATVNIELPNPFALKRQNRYLIVVVGG